MKIFRTLLSVFGVFSTRTVVQSFPSEGNTTRTSFPSRLLTASFDTRWYAQPSAARNAAKEYDPSYDYHVDPVAILFVRSHLRLVVDLQTNIKAQQRAAYARKVKLSNLKEMARTVVYIQEHGYDTVDDLQKHRQACP